MGAPGGTKHGGRAQLPSGSRPLLPARLSQEKQPPQPCFEDGLMPLFFFLKANLFIYLFIYFWLCWVFVSVRGLSLVAASGGHSSSRCAGLSLSRPLLLRLAGSRRAGSVVVAHGPSCSAACGIFPDQGSNPCPPHWQADSQPLRHQGSPCLCFYGSFFRGNGTNRQGLASAPVGEGDVVARAVVAPEVCLRVWRPGSPGHRQGEGVKDGRRVP